MALKLTQEMFIPKGSEEVDTGNLPCRVFIYTGDTHQQPSAMMFRGNRAKPESHYRYRTEARRDESVQQFVDSVKNNVKEKEARSTAKKAHTTSLQIGDVMVASWGYGQTNIDFYQVVGVSGTGKSIKVREIAGNYKEEGYMCGHTTPQVDVFIGPVENKKVSIHDTITFSSFKSAHIWSGSPEYKSSYH